MNRDKTEVLVRLIEDIGYTLAAFEALKSDKGCSEELFRCAEERLKTSHEAITEVFITVGEDA